jgi:hypothetical protein
VQLSIDNRDKSIPIENSAPMHPRKKHTVFLSRVSTEFKELTDRVRLSDDAYPLLRLIDQESPYGIPSSTAAPLTVNKLHDWVSNCDTVFHYVGVQSGAKARVPTSADKPLDELLDASCMPTLDSLRAHFQSVFIGSEPDSFITYTMLEVILAIGLSKELLIFWLDPKTAIATAPGNPPIDSAQQAYRDWLYQHHLSGRDRVPLDFPEDIIASSARKLQSLDRAVALEYRANFAQNQNPLWEAIALIADPNTNQDEANSHWTEIRDRTASTAIDWIRDAVEVSDPHNPRSVAPDPIYYQVPESEDSNQHNWLVPVRSQLHRIVIDQQTIRNEAWPGIPGHSVRACCVAEQSVWVLCEDQLQYALHRLEPNGQKQTFRLEGFQTHGLHPIQLSYAQGSFYLNYQGTMWQAPCDLANREWTAKPCNRASQSAIGTLSGFVEQLSLPRSFPFHRGFDGQTYDTRSSDAGDAAWAIVKERHKLFGITLFRGCFLDLFKTVDVTLDGPYEECKVQRTRNGLVAWDIIPADGDAALRVPLFACSAKFGAWKCLGTETRIVQSAQSAQQTERVCQVRPDTPGDFVPNCFTQHSKSDGDGDRSRFRVWLFPRRIDAQIAQQMLPFTQHFTPLPSPPIDSPENLATANAKAFDDLDSWLADWDPWYQKLWRQCQE